MLKSLLNIFFALEAHNFNKKTINKIRDQNGDIKEGTYPVLEVLNNYYAGVFSDKNLDIDMDYLAMIDLPQVSEKDRYWMEGSIQIEEIHLALKKMNLSKCPGSDGLTVEFYLKFWPMLATTIHKLFNTIVERRIMNKTAREGITSLMIKPHRDELNIQTWRPLSLLNNDYKLYAKVLAERFSATTRYIIPKEQRGFIKGRSITDNLLNLLSVIEHCNSNDIDSLLISIDYHQAFGSCSWKAIELSLNVFGYGPRFISMVMTCYNEIKTAIMNNNTWSNWINLQSGVRQGCPLSGILFNHLVSIVYYKISQNENIQGIEINNSIKLADMFADDMWNAIPYDPDIFSELMFEYSEFEHFAGLRINYNKTEIMRMGSIRGSNAQFYTQLPLIWSDGPIRILGIDVYHNWELSADKNYENIMNKINDIARMWEARSVTPIGKIQIINSLMNSQFTYKLQVLNAPRMDLMVKYKKAVTKFIWGSSRAKILYSRLIAAFSHGGQQLRDIVLVNKSNKLAMIQKLSDPKIKETWKDFIIEKYGVDVDYLLACNMNPKDVTKFVSLNFARDMLQYWMEQCYHFPQNVSQVLAQHLWYNSHIKIANRWIFNKSLYRIGIKKIVDLYNLDEGKCYTYDKFVNLYNTDITFLWFM